MRTVILEADQDPETGETGLYIPGITRGDSTNASRDGLSIAHDLIEHVNGPSLIGTIDDELEALGAVWYVRGQHGELRHDSMGNAYTIYQNIAADITRMYRDFICGAATVHFDSPRTRPCLHDNDLQQILTDADNTYLQEFDRETEEYNEAKAHWAAYRALSLHRMRTGHRKAYRRWEHRGQYAANVQFWAIADAVDTHARHANYIGQQFKLRYGNREATCEEVYTD